MQPSFLTHLPWRAILVLWLAVVSSGLAADALKGEALFSGWWPAGAERYKGLVALGAIILSLAASLGVYVHRRAFTVARSLSRQLCQPHACLILLVSRATPNITPGSPPFPLRVTMPNGDSVELRGISLEEDIQRLDSVRWNWQQLLRALVPHLQGARLQRIYLIGSPGPEGSFAQLSMCRAIVQHYLPRVHIHMVNEAVDFEDFNRLVQCMRDIIERERQHGMRKQDIIIDVTGGFKTASIAGASITFNSQVTFQYVQTQAPYEVFAYDVLYQKSFGSGTMAEKAKH